MSVRLSWPALGSRSNILQILVMESLAVQEAAVCPLHPADYVSHQRVKEPLFQEFKWGGHWGICCKQTNQPFSPQSMTAKTVPASRRGMNGSLPFATKVYNMWPTFTSTACTSLGMFFCGTVNLNLAESLWFLPCPDIPSASAAGTAQHHWAAQQTGFCFLDVRLGESR